ncbi:MAG: ATP synthase F1 subunit delta [Thermoanaerobaculia bacterium]|nr:ATP synthase F1 subunit delta [Thermoanaerobaculia bacterium]
MIRRFARPYAKAIMEVVKTPDAARALHDELARFETARAGSEDLSTLFENPGVDAKVKKSITAAIGAKLAISELGLRVLDVFVTNDRINDLSAILEALAAMINDATNTVVARVRAAHQLGEDEKAELTKALEARLGRRVQLELELDSALLGGFVAEVGSEVYDASVLARIQKIRTAIA